MIEEIKIENLAEKIQKNVPLSDLEKTAVIAVLLDYGRQKNARAAGGRKTRGGGRPRSAEPSASAIYQRQRRADKKKIGAATDSD